MINKLFNLITKYKTLINKINNIVSQKYYMITKYKILITK